MVAQFSGYPQRKPVDIVSVFEAVGQEASGSIGKEELKEIECRSFGPDPAVVCIQPTPWLLQLTFGMSLPSNSAQLAVSKDKKIRQRRAAVLELVRKNIRLAIS